MKTPDDVMMTNLDMESTSLLLSRNPIERVARTRMGFDFDAGISGSSHE
jgi:hypothetical protein